MNLTETELLKSLFQMRLRIFSKLPETRGFNEGALAGVKVEKKVKLYILHNDKWTELFN